MSGLFGLFPHMFDAPGTGGVEANTKRAEQSAKLTDQWLTPIKQKFADYLQGKTPMSGLPQPFQTPDWRATQQQVQDAYDNSGYESLADLMRKNTALATEANLRRGFQSDPGAVMSLADLQADWQNRLAQNKADALVKGLDVGGQLRSEGATNWWNMLKSLADNSTAQTYLNTAGLYGQLGQSSMAGLNTLLNAAGKMAGYYYGMPGG